MPPRAQKTRASQKRAPTPVFSSDGETHRAVCEKLASSGLTEATGHALGLKGLTATETQALDTTFKAVRSLYIPYHDALGEPTTDWPSCPPFFRLRYLDATVTATVLTDAKETRYVQRPHTMPVAYFPRNIDWATLVDDVDQPLIITEGELKAAKACQEGFPTIGLGGVYNWRSYKNGLILLPELKAVQWARRNVYICYDSDLTTNKNIQRAAWELTEALEHRGALVHLVVLTRPSTPEVAVDREKKMGIDDFFVMAGARGPELFTQALASAMPLGLGRALYDYNARFLYVRNPGLVIDLKEHIKIGPKPFVDHVESERQCTKGVIRTDGTVQYELVSASAEWLAWPLRNKVSGLTYQPGEPRELEQKGQTMYNLWEGWGVEPKKGDVKPFLTLVAHLFEDAEPGAMQWFLQWCAYPLKYPGAKLFSSVAIHGRRHGTGKSLVGYTIGRIYGKNFAEITQVDLHGTFNEWADGKQFVLGDDVTGPNKRQESDMLKKLITQREIRVNQKYVPSYVVPDCINYYFTSNHPDAFFLEDDDRRFFVHEVVADPLPEAFYAEYDLWVDAGGSAAVFDYLLKLDVGAFNPAGPAFKTMARERMIADGQSDLGTWVRTLMTTPDTILRIGDIPLTHDCYTAVELLRLYDPTGHTRTTANGLARELRRAGVPLVLKGMPVKMADGSQARFYAIRHLSRWRTASAQEVARHVATARTATRPPAKY